MPKVIGSGRKEAMEWSEVVRRDSKKVECKYCNANVSGKIERIRAHMKKCPVRARSQHLGEVVESDAEDDDIHLTDAFTSSSLPLSSEARPSSSTSSLSIIGTAGKDTACATYKHQTSMREFTIKTTEAQKKILDRKIASFFYACNIPFNAIENRECIEMVDSLRPGYKPPNRKQLGGKLLDEAACDIDMRMKEELKNATVTLVQDGWSSVTNDPIIASSLCTGSKTFLVDATDTGSNKKTSEYCASIAENTITSIKEKYNKQVFALCTDNENKMKKMKEILREPDKFPKLLTYGCNAHYLNLIEKEVSPAPIIKQIVVVQKYFRNHHQPHAWLKEKQGLMPQLPNDTRWNSQEDCLHTFISNFHKYVEIRMDTDANPDSNVKFDPAVARVLDNVGLHTTAIHLQKQLKEVSVALDKLQADTTTISDAVEVWIDLLESYELEPFRATIRERFESAMEPFHFLANIMDPRYNGRRLTVAQEQLAEDWVQNQYPEYLPGVMAFTIKDPDIFPPNLFQDSVVSSILPTKWWKIAAQKSEKLKSLPGGFCQFFSSLHTCPASSASIERLFSTFGIVWSKLRNRLGVDKAQKLVTVYRYLRDKNQCEWDW